ncbi:MAG TPA: hypothetical protein VK864_15630, partial [Longimicrobiales bacterium]|nr:hypothetical protein [Longimicrobiales bacterium]
MPEIAWPSAVVFDPAAARVPPDIDKLFPMQERIAVVLLLAGAHAREQGWSAQAAIRLADHCGATGRCVLIDLAFDDGELHDPLAAENVEGIADVFLYGASVRHVEQRPARRAFEFLSVGDAAGEAETVIGHSRWPR